MKVKEIFRTGNLVVDGLHHRPIAIDITYIPDHVKKPAIVFSHGFKGFKDWGHFNIMASEFARQGFIFIKFNFSHNGIISGDTNEFNDLEAFANNNFSIELDDLGVVLDWLEKNSLLKKDFHPENIFLVGHSRGGGISILKANEDPRIKKVVTWAAPFSFENRFNPEEIEQWKKDGVVYVDNSRTQQKMPMYYQIVEDFIKNKKRMDIPAAARNLKIPCLIVQGTADDVVDAQDADLLKKYIPSAELFLIKDADHTFGVSHPYSYTELQNDFLKVFNKTCSFLKSLPDIKTKN